MSRIDSPKPLGRWLAAVLLALAPSLVWAQAATKTAPAKAVNAAACFGCHTQIKTFYDVGKHKSTGCATCHGGLEAHLANASQAPSTDTSLKLCGSCHKEQYETAAQMDWHRLARSDKKLYWNPAPNPSFDLLMTPNAFTKEHNLPRSHTFALLDQFLVDRAFGGRFEPKDGWQYLAKSGDMKLQEMIVDKYPDNTDQKVFRPGTAAAANPVCLSCKTQDMILEWAYLGDPAPRAKWSRTSKVVEMGKSVNHSLNCIFCHDPHATKPRVVRDALIQALTRTDFPTLYSEDPRKTKFEVQDVGMRGFPRKIAFLERYDSKLQCAQCHVEYNCNPGFNPNTGEAITMADPRTNVFPFVNVFQVSKFYDQIQFRDFRNQFTGAALTKAQHPDTEIYWGSKHDKAGVECASCHMPRIENKKTGKVYTSHWQANPKDYLKETCLRCHSQWDEKQAKYVIESLYQRTQAKMRHAEFWLDLLVNKFMEAQALGVSDDVIKAARAKHGEAHINWEWWTAANAAGFHNPEQAHLSLANSVTYSQEGIKILDDAMKTKRAALQPVADKK